MFYGILLGLTIANASKAADKAIDFQKVICDTDKKLNTMSQHKKILPMSLKKNIISAEIEPIPGHANQAALALQKRGFRILHIGSTISVEGSEALWESIFNVLFETRKKTVLSDVKGGEVTYRKAITENMKIPFELQQVIKEVMFMEPPEFY